MVIVDALAVGVLLAGLLIGVTRGLVATAGSIVGLVIGCVAAVWVTPLIAPGVASWQYRSLVLTICVLAIVGGGVALGTAVGAALRRGVERSKLGVVDRVFGGVVDTVVAGFAVLLLAGSVTASGMPLVATAVGSSRVVQALDALTPAPVDGALAQVRGFVVDEGIPRMEELLRPEVEPTAPPVALEDPDLQRAAASVARITGTAYACGLSVTGSGFVAAPGLVVTNAHVVAGVDAPVVDLPAERPREGRVVYFDPVDDLAVIAIDDLTTASLPVADPVTAGEAVAVQGYPLGGPFTNESAWVLSVGEAPVFDIYDGARTMRDIYALHASVRPGNSGGPLLSEDGDVVGVVFARGVDGDPRGYAMTTRELRPALAGLAVDDPAVSTGRCG